jgi:hypothetical protein
MVAVPTACLMVLWGLAVALGSGLDDHLSSMTRHHLGELILLGGGALLVIVIAVILMGSFARRLSRDISDLAATARQLADEQLPQVVERLRSGVPAAGR